MLHTSSRRLVPGLVISSLMIAGSALAATSLLPVAEGDLAATTLAVPTADKAGPTVSHDAVRFAWPVAADAALDPAPTLATATSREYWLTLDAADLRAGIEIPTTANAALIRVNPVAGEAALKTGRLEPTTFEVVDPKGVVHRNGAAMDRIADSDQLKAAGAPFADGTVAFRIRPQLGAGTFVLRAPAIPLSDHRTFVVHVFDQGSPYELRAATSADAFLLGDRLTADLALDGASRLAKAEVEAALISPSGLRTPLPVDWTGEAGTSLEALLDRADSLTDGLWELHARIAAVADGLPVRRDVRVAFAVSVPTARFDGRVEVQRADGGLGIDLGLETAAAGRYETRGMLWGTDAAGELRPLAVVDSAAWLEPGHGTLRLEADDALIAGSGLGAPFELRDLRLMDQGRMGLLHRQQRALRID